MFRLENKKSLLGKFVLLSVLFTGLLTGCETVPEPEPEPEDQKASAKVIAVNEFIKLVMDDVYLWYKELPEIDNHYEFDSKKYFNKLLYTDDKWSYISDDAAKELESGEGRETTYGWSLGFGMFSNTETVFGLVEFVYPDSPAEKAGIKRGDIIFEMDGLDITENNYMDLLNSSSASFTYGQVISGSIKNEKTISLTAQEMDVDPVQFTNIIEHGGHKIGYLFYAQFVLNHNKSMDAALKYFLDNSITDLVLDLRYNPGGYGGPTQYLCSSLAPVDVVNNKSVLIKYQYNDKYHDYFVQQNREDELGINFIDTVTHKMGLSKIHIITGTGTASASEVTITGLRPYMTVKTVGESTYGKYTGSWLLLPEYFYNDPADYEDFENWLVQPIVFQYENSLGVTDFKDGFMADIPVEDDLFSPIPLGDKKEIMLKTAIEDITGEDVVALQSKSAGLKRNYKIFDRGFSKYDAGKRDFIGGVFDKSKKK